MNALHLPLQEVKELSFCSSAKAVKVGAWVNNLQATKITHTSIVLYNAIPELNKLKTDFDNRINSLEQVRPTVQNCIQGLTREFLHQPLILPENAQKVAIVSQALQKNMLDGYLLCIREISNLSRFKPETITSLSKAIHRAITGIGLFFFRTYQLYTQIPAGMWHILHGLYQTAEYYELLDRSISDSTLTNNTSSTIRNAYVRVLMLASCRANQLNQNDVAHAYAAFAQWASLVKINSGISPDKDNFYIANLSQDSSPSYKSRFEGTEADTIIELDFKTLLGMLSKQGGQGEEVLGNAHSVTIPKDFPEALLSHLLSTWGNVSQRKMGRRDVNISADICVGLVDSHYFLAGKRKFEEYISGNNNSDDWHSGGGGFTPRDMNQRDNSPADESGRPTWKITIQNVSVGGYCLLWQGDIPPRVEAGEIICLREAGRQSWNLGVVRWIKQLKQASQLGIQLLSNHPSVCGAAQIFDMGGQSDFMRSLILPPAKHSGAPATLITSNAPFGEMQKAKIFTSDKTLTVRLDRCIFATGSIQQFVYRALESSGDEQSSRSPSRTSGRDEFDSSWDDI